MDRREKGDRTERRMRKKIQTQDTEDEADAGPIAAQWRCIP